MSITHGLHRSLQQRPAAVATICGDRTRTVAEMYERVARLAAGLLDVGLHPGDRVAVVSHNSDRMLEVLLAISWAGLVFSPLNTRWSPDELGYAVTDVGASALVVDDAFVPVASDLRSRCPGLTATIVLGDASGPADALASEDLIAGCAPVTDADVPPDAVAGVFYTGGTTGAPKGVVLSHGNLTAAALGALATGEFMCPRGTALHVAPLFHLAGIWPWIAEMLLGGRHVVLPAFEPAAVITAIAEHDVTDVLLVPVMIQHVVAALERSGTALPGLRHLIYAGSPISEALLGRTEAVLPDVALVQGYGMTELAPVATLLLGDEHVGTRRRSAGRAVAPARVRVVDPDDTDVPAGQVGEILVAGPHVMQGYWNRPEDTATALRGGWMHTGDAGHLDEHGYVHVVDRLKDMIISGGENVYSAEVENALASHPAVVQCAVVGVPDDDWGERVHAVIVLADGAAEPDLDELRDHVGARIARYKAPRSVEVVDALPVSAAGKVLKRELRAAL